MTRVIAGRARGRHLVTPPGTGTRPTSDRAREALFSALEARLGAFAGARFLDLYAGSGAVGLEALSRGAAHVLLVESERTAAAAVRANVAALDLPGAQVSVAPVERLVASPAPAAPYDVAYLDPPYALAAPEVVQVLSALLAGHWLAPDALVVVERATRDRAWSADSWPAGLVADSDRRYGEATLWYGRAAGHPGP
jgi:16S rRNA (guanine966-N2)-methyltransferase